MGDVTPARPFQGQNPAQTRQDELESPHQQNIRTSKRQRPAAAQAPIPLNIGGGVAINNSVAGAVNHQIQAALSATQTRYNIISSLAEAIDKCMEGYTSPTEAAIARELQQRVVKALTSSLDSPSITTSNPASDSETTQRSWADVAQTLKNPSNTGRGGPKPNKGITPQNRQAPHQNKRTDDPRILITVSTEFRLQQPSPFAIRQAICAAVEGVSLQDIPKATTTKTGWAITPANNRIGTLLMEQVNQELMLRAVNGDSARLPERWINYAVQGVASAYRSVMGTEIPTTVELVKEEVYSQTLQHPASCRPSRHGPNLKGLTTWIVSFQQPVRSFSLFGTSEYSKEIKKNPPIQLHNPGCQGFCNPARCTRAACCQNCSIRIKDHIGPSGDECSNRPRCANCHGPFKASHHGCSAAPINVGGRLTRPTKKELGILRKAGHRASQQALAALSQQPTTSGSQTDLSDSSGRNTAEGTTPPQVSTAGSPAEGITPPQVTSAGGLAEGTTPPQDTSTASEPNIQKRGRQDMRQLTVGSTATSSESSANPAPRRPPRATANRKDLNIRRLSAQSIRQRNPDHTDPSSSEQADFEMSEETSSC